VAGEALPLRLTAIDAKRSITSWPAARRELSALPPAAAASPTVSDPWSARPVIESAPPDHMDSNPPPLTCTVSTLNTYEAASTGMV